MLTACGAAPIAQTNANINTIDDKNLLESILLHAYLGLSHPLNIETLATGEEYVDELKEFKQLEKLYMLNVEPASGSFSKKNLAILMFFAAYASDRNNAAFNEYLAADLTPVFKEVPERFLSQLANIPSVTEMVCDRLAAYYSSEAAESKDINEFVARYKSQFQSYLTADQYKICLLELES